MVASSFGLMTAVKASIGGILLGFATSIHPILYKRITGVSGILEKAMTKDAESWQLSFLLGIYHSACIYVFATGGIIFREIPFYFYILGGLLVGFGTRLGNGCTSGHGICGLTRLNPRSFVAVGTFMSTAIITANLLYFNHSYEFSSNNSFKNSSEWSGSNKYLGWALFSLLSLLLFKISYTIVDGQDLNLFHNLQFKELCALYIVGALFGLGLALSGMVDNNVVLSFLVFNKDWNPSLLFVLGFAVLVFSCFYWYTELIKPTPNETDAEKGPDGITC